MNTLTDMLCAQSIAIIGASANPSKMGYTLMKNLLDGGYEGRLYPVNLKEKVILGQCCYPNLSAIDSDVELIVICVPAAHTIGVMEEAAKKCVRGAIIISGGFREIGSDELERQLLATARSAGIRIIGPNCQGINYTVNKLCATWPLVTVHGCVGIVSQSGTIGAELELLLSKDGIGVSCFAALGNKLDISEADFVDFFVSDPSTRVIALNIEGIQEDSGFVQSVMNASQKKPVIILKPGRTIKGMAAAASHTKSITGDDRLFSVFCIKYGLARVNDMTEFYDLCKLAAWMIPPKGNRILIVSSSGGAGILATDAAEDVGLDVVGLDEEIKIALGNVLPPQCVLSNPLDLTGDATADRYCDALLAIVEQRSRFDSILVIFGDPIHGACQAVQDIKTVLGLPVAVSYLGGGQVQQAETEAMCREQIPVFPTPERAIRAVGALYKTKKQMEA